MELKLSRDQGKFYYSTAKSVAAVAGFGSGKTAIAMYRCTSSMFDFPRNNFLYLAPTYQLVKDIWYPAIEEYFDKLEVQFKINKSDNVIKVKDHGNIYCRSMEFPKRIVGFEVLDAFLDELDILKAEKAYEVWRKTKARCRQKPKGRKSKKKYKKTYKVKKKNQMYVSTTPEGFRATYEMFKETPLKNSELIQMSTYSNAHNLPKDYIDELKANYPPQLIEAYINGKFVNLVNMPVWSCYDQILNNSREVVEGNEPLTVGIDFNVGRGCAVIYVDRNKIYCNDKRHSQYQEFKQFIFNKQNMGEVVDDKYIESKRDHFPPEYEMHSVDEIVDTYDTPATIKVLNERYPKNHITVIPDTTGKNRKSVNATINDIQLLIDEGYTVLRNSKNPPVKGRVMSTNARFCNAAGERSLFVNKQTCPVFSKGLIKQVYDKNLMPEKGEGKHDDITDSGSYPVVYRFPIKKPKTTLQRIPL